MIRDTTGAANAAPVDTTLKDLYFLDTLGELTQLTQSVVEWYYHDKDVIDICYEDIDDRASIVHITKLIGDTLKTQSITIGTLQKKQINRSFRIHNPNLV